MYFITVYVLFCIFLFSPVLSALPTPVALWPLSEASFAYDVSNGIDGVNPTLDDCFKVNETGNPGLFYGALYFDDQDSRYVDIRIPGPSMSSFAFSLQFYSQRTTSALIHFVSDGFSANDVTDIQVRFISSRLTVFVENADLFSFTDFLDLNTWTTLTFGHDGANGKLSIYKNNVKIGVLVNSIYPALKLPGVLRLGNPQFPVIDQFEGMMTCLSLYDVAAGFDTDYADILNNCNAPWSSPPPYAPSCFLDCTPASLWPLDDTYYGFDVMRQSHPINKETCFRIVSTLGKNVLVFDGSRHSVVQSSIFAYVLQGTFTIAASVYVAQDSVGTIFYASVSPEVVSDGITQIELSILNTQHLRVQIHTTVSKCADFETDTTISYEVWSTVSVQRTKHSNKLSVIVDGTESFIADNCSVTANVSSSVTGMIYIGGGSGIIGNYRGQLHCLGLFESLLPSSSVATTLTTLCSKPYLSEGNPCNVNPTRRSNYYKMHKRNVIPNLDISALESLTTKYLRECYSACIMSALCRSFTVAGTECSLYDFVTTNRFSNQTGTKYYIAKY